MKLTSIYFAACITPGGTLLGAIKVGCAANPAKRAMQLSSGQPYTCDVLATCPGGFLEEAVLHEWLLSESISGEFFRDGPKVRALITSVRETSCFPLPLAHAPNVRLVTWFDKLGIAHFMDAHGLTHREAAKLTGRRLTFFQAGEAAKKPPRRYVAALAVAAIRKGHSVSWEADFLAGPPPELARAA